MKRYEFGQDADGLGELRVVEIRDDAVTRTWVLAEGLSPGWATELRELVACANFAVSIAIVRDFLGRGS